MGAFIRANVSWLVLLVALSAGAAYGGYRWGSAAGRTLARATQTQLTNCEEGQQAVMQAGKQYAAESAELEDELQREQAAHARDNKTHEDSMRVIVDMLPDEAERAIADHYRRQRQQAASGRKY